MKNHFITLFEATHIRTTMTLLTIALLLIIIALAWGITDNPPAIAMLFAGIIMVFYSIIHTWKMVACYGTLVAACGIILPLVWGNQTLGEFIDYTVGGICAAGILVGVTGMIIKLFVNARKHQLKQDRRINKASNTDMTEMTKNRNVVMSICLIASAGLQALSYWDEIAGPHLVDAIVTGFSVICFAWLGLIMLKRYSWMKWVLLLIIIFEIFNLIEVIRFRSELTLILTILQCSLIISAMILQVVPCNLEEKEQPA